MLQTLKMFLLVLVCFLKSSLSVGFSTKGNKVFDPNGNWIVFRGIGLTCTEYMMKPNMDSLSPYNGYWAYTSCFGGPSSDGGPIKLNDEAANVMKYFSGNNFVTNPTITKVVFDSPYNEILELDTPNLHPIIRIPMSGSCYLYDSDVDTGNHMDYVNTIDAIVEYFTNNKVGVILDLHWNCPDTTTISGCTVAQSASMALSNYGNLPGSVAFWNATSSKYFDNPYVFYELFNEPWIQQFDPWYNGGNGYAGMKEMYEAVRKNDPDGIVIIGANQYALDAQTPIAMYIQYQQDTNSELTNVIWNSHPYQGGGQGYEHSLQSEMRFTMAMKLIGPVIYTEFGQYCCSSSGNKECTGGNGQCSHHNTGDNFVFNIVNMATQYDISTIGWGWRGTNDDYPCGNLPDCNQPDMRSGTGALVNGTYGGADWQRVWDTFIGNSNIIVLDTTNGSPLDSSANEESGYLPRPCIIGDYNLGQICGYDLSTNINTISVSDLTSQSIYDSILPGLPPNGSCTAQGCPGTPCQTYTGPCH